MENNKRSIFEEKTVKYNGKTFDKYSVTPYGAVINKKTRKVLKPREMKNSHGEHLQGYNIVDIYDNEGKKETKLHHKIVAEAYIDNPDNLETVNHKNGNKHINYYDNLEWMSTRDNNIHAIENGLTSRQKCENHRNATLTNSIVRDICKLLEQGYLYKEIVDELDLHHIDNIMSKIKMIKTGNAWTDISKDYHFQKSKNMKHLYPDSLIHEICNYLQENGFTNNDDILDNLGIEKNEKTRKLIYVIRTRRKYNYISKDYSF